MAKIIATLTLIFSLLFGGYGVQPAPSEADVIFKAVLVADTHADADPVRDRTDGLRECMAAIGENQADADCIVLAGDITNSGDLREYTGMQSIMNAYCRIPARIPAFGNHDSWHHSDDPDFGRAVMHFKSFCRMNGVYANEVYYRKNVNGYAFITTGPEDCDFGDMYISDRQFQWLDRELTEACIYRKPVFVICHKPFSSIGPCAERLESILTEHANTGRALIVLVSGHKHALGEETFTRLAKNLISLNLPSLQYTEPGGLGFIAEVTASRLTLTGMNFLTGETLNGYTFFTEY